MNERILSLARQVWPDPNISHTNHMKFAELIVKECLIAIDKTDITHIYTTFDQSMVMGTIEKSKKAVKEHFGM